MTLRSVGIDLGSRIVCPPRALVRTRQQARSVTHGEDRPSPRLSPLPLSQPDRLNRLCQAVLELFQAWVAHPG